MRVAVVTRYFPSSAEPSQGRSAYSTLRILARSCDVRVFYPHPVYPRWATPAADRGVHIDPTFRPDDVAVTYFRFPAFPVLSRPLNGWMAARALTSSISAYDPDILLGFFLYPDSFAALRIARALKKPVVAMSIGSDLNRITDWASAHHTRTVLREADYVITVSEALRQRAIEKGASTSRTKSILNGCDLSVFHVRDRARCRAMLGLQLEADAVVYVGRLDVRKGLLELVHAAAILHEHRPDLHHYIVGEGPARSEITSAVVNHGACDYIHLPGACTFEQVALWMGAATLVTLPSYMEGCPNVLIEALACGRPVVATDVGGIPEIVTADCGRLIRPRDASQLASAIDAVLGATWDAPSLASHAGRSWEMVADELMKVFDNVGR